MWTSINTEAIREKSLLKKYLLKASCVRSTPGIYREPLINGTPNSCFADDNEGISFGVNSKSASWIIKTLPEDFEIPVLTAVSFPKVISC